MLFRARRIRKRFPSADATLRSLRTNVTAAIPIRIIFSRKVASDDFEPIDGALTWTKRVREMAKTIVPLGYSIVRRRRRFIFLTRMSVTYWRVFCSGSAPMISETADRSITERPGGGGFPVSPRRGVR